MRKLRHGIAVIGALLFWQPAGGAETGVAASARVEAYELYEQKQFEASAAQFKRYVELNPDDLAAAFDYAAVLSQLKQHDEAAEN